MRFAITGGFGYLGPRVAEWLRSKGHHVVVAARVTPPAMGAWASRFEVRRCDVLDAASTHAAAAGADAVVHLASLDENEASRSPALALSTAVEGTQNVLAAALATGARVIYLSTFHVYTPAPHLDESSALGASHPYAASRIAAEKVCFEAEGAPPCTILRLSNVYGAPVVSSVDRWTLAHNDFTRQAVMSSRIVLQTPGLQQRDFVWVEDVARAIEIVADRGAPGCECYNVGSQTSSSIADLAERVRVVAERRLDRRIAVERPTGGSPHAPVLFSIARLRALGFAPTDQVDLETGKILDLLATGPLNPGE